MLEKLKYKDIITNTVGILSFIGFFLTHKIENIILKIAIYIICSIVIIIILIKSSPKTINFFKKISKINIISRENNDLKEENNKLKCDNKKLAEKYDTLNNELEEFQLATPLDYNLEIDQISINFMEYMTIISKQSLVISENIYDLTKQVLIDLRIILLNNYTSSKFDIQIFKLVNSKYNLICSTKHLQSEMSNIIFNKDSLVDKVYKEKSCIITNTNDDSTSFKHRNKTNCSFDQLFSKYIEVNGNAVVCCITLKKDTIPITDLYQSYERIIHMYISYMLLIHFKGKDDNKYGK